MADPYVITPTAEPPTSPGPPDLMETNDPPHIADPKPTKLEMAFKAALLNEENSLNGHYLMGDNGKLPLMPTETGAIVLLSPEDKERIYAPWRFSVIVKLFKKRLPHIYLRNKLVELWKPTEPLTLIDLGNDFYIAKFSNPENMQKALHGVLWFVIGSFLSVRHSKPNFIPEEATQSYTTIWIRLPQLPMKFYHENILERIGNKLGTLLKIDTCTSATLRGSKTHSTAEEWKTVSFLKKKTIAKPPTNAGKESSKGDQTQGPSLSGSTGISDLPKVSPGIGPVGALNANHSPPINSIATSLMLESPNGVRYPTPLGETPINVFVYAYSGKSNSITTRDNHHPRSVDMTNEVMSINSSSDLSASLNPQIPNKEHIPAPSTNNESSSSQQKPTVSKGTSLLHDCTTSIQPGTNIVGGTGTSGEDHNSLHYCRGPTNSPLHPRSCLDDANSERSSQPNSRESGIPSMVPNPIASSEVGDPQYDELQGDELTYAPHVQEPSFLPNNPLSTLEPNGEIQFSTPIPTTATGRIPKRNDYLSTR
ncbi:hypothetical protein FXO37_35945 [Capsicum annuum]|nr:hypothetical protein FXO37_35945 [Capsicum annuum]